MVRGLFTFISLLIHSTYSPFSRFLETLQENHFPNYTISGGNVANVNFAEHPSLSVNTPYTVNIGSKTGVVVVTNEGTDPSDTTKYIYFTTNNATPTVRGADTYVVYPGDEKKVQLGADPVKLVAGGSVKCSVVAVQ